MPVHMRIHICEHPESKEENLYRERGREEKRERSKGRERERERMLVKGETIVVILGLFSAM